ncbi:MAG TPA: glycosyltransferase family 39 protein, partial [Pirellulaceae bacterium]|nr:glycosyltransferase family 39 protein [Pirellulaceae bacterium]
MPEKPNWPVVAALLLIVLLAAWLRWTSLGDSLWIDEHHTAWIVAQDLDDVAPRAMIGNQSPLVYWPFWGYIQFAGLNEFALRLPFFLASLIVVALVYGLVWSWTRSLMGAITAGLLVAIYDNAIYYGVESRIYAAVQLAGLCHLLLFASLLYRPTWWRRVVWVVLGALLLHLHYTAGLLLAAECVAY